MFETSMRHAIISNATIMEKATFNFRYNTDTTFWSIKLSEFVL